MKNNPLFKPGHTACAGCGQAIAAKIVVETAGPNTIIANSTGCLEVFTTAYPDSAWNVPWIHSLFENSAAVASGIEAAMIYLGKKEGTNIIAQGGDGGTGDIGIQALSGMLERGHDILYVCLPPETELILGDGSIVEIGDIVDKIILSGEKETKELIFSCEKITQKIYFSKNSCGYDTYADSNLLIPVKEKAERSTESVEIAPARGKDVLSWDRSQFLPVKVTCVQRKTSPDTLIKITTASGQKLSLTPEHPVLIDTLDGPKWQRAGLVKQKDEVYAPRRIRLDTKNEFYIVDYLDAGIRVKLAPQVKEKINRELKNRYGSLKKASRAIGFKYWQFKETARFVDLGGLRKIFKETPALKWEEFRPYLSEFCVQGGAAVKIEGMRLTQDLMYLLGLVSSDGYLNPKNHAVVFVNKEPALIECFRNLYRNLFCGRRISEIKDESDTAHLTVSDPVFSSLGKNLEVKSNPKELIKFPEELITSFVRGFFDGDGYCGIVKTRHSQDPRIILSTVEKGLAKRLRLMLQRLGIACSQVDREDRFDLVISSKEDIERFIEKVSTRHPSRRKRMEEIGNLCKTRNSRGRFFSIAPKACGRILKDICERENVPITRLDRKRNICTLAAGSRRATKARIARFKNALVRIIGRDDEKLFSELDLYLRDDFYLDPVEKIEIIPCKSKYVYDITVDATHLFIPEGAFVISNCYDNESYMNTGIQRSGLTPFGMNTTTTPVGSLSMGNPNPKKPLPEICAAHGVPYVATASVGLYQDLQRKVKKALSIKGPKYIQVHVPCPLGWRHEPNRTLEVAKLAVDTGLYPLVEFENGSLSGVKKITSKPVEEYLKAQARFKHLLKNPEEIKKIQDIADSNIKKYGLKVEAGQT